MHGLGVRKTPGAAARLEGTTARQPTWMQAEVEVWTTGQHYSDSALTRARETSSSAPSLHAASSICSVGGAGGSESVPCVHAEMRPGACHCTAGGPIHLTDHLQAPENLCSTCAASRSLPLSAATPRCLSEASVYLWQPGVGCQERNNQQTRRRARGQLLRLQLPGWQVVQPHAV